MSEFPVMSIADASADARKTFDSFPLENGKYFTPGSLYKFYHKTPKRMTMEEATASFNNFVAGSGRNTNQLDFESFSACLKFHMDKINNAAESTKMKTDLSRATLKMIGDDHQQFIKLFDLPSDLTKEECQAIMKDMENFLPS